MYMIYVYIHNYINTNIVTIELSLHDFNPNKTPPGHKYSYLINAKHTNKGNIDSKVSKNKCK